MLTEVRWQKEQELMQSVFPQFKPFTRGAGFGFDGYLKGAVFGFEGYLKGPRSRRCYRVLLEADEMAYPQCPPNVRMGSRNRGALDRAGRPAGPLCHEKLAAGQVYFR